MAQVFCCIHPLIMIFNSLFSLFIVELTQPALAIDHDEVIFDTIITAALQQLGGLCLKTIDENFSDQFYDWINDPATPKNDYSQSIPKSLNHLFSGKTQVIEEFALSTAEYDLLT